MLTECYSGMMLLTTKFLPIKNELMAVRKSNTFLDVLKRFSNDVIAPALFYAG